MALNKNNYDNVLSIGMLFIMGFFYNSKWKGNNQKYLRDVYCVSTYHSKDQETQSTLSYSHKTTNWFIASNILACGLVSHARLAFFLQHNNIPEIFLVFVVFPVRLSTQRQENWTSQSFLYSRLQFRVTNVNQIKIHLLPPHLRPHYWFGSTAAHTCSVLRIPLAASHASCSSSGTS